MELYFDNECGFSQNVLMTITNLGIQDQLVMKNIRENPEFRKELIEWTGNSQVPTLIVDHQPMRESQVINEYLVDRFVA